MKIADFSISNKALTFSELAMKFLDSAPDDEVFKLYELAAAINRKIPSTLSHLSPVFLERYSTKILADSRYVHVYGNPKAIKSLRKKLGL